MDGMASIYAVSAPPRKIRLMMDGCGLYLQPAVQE
jgi:hypothetical protein